MWSYADLNSTRMSGWCGCLSSNSVTLIGWSMDCFFLPCARLYVNYYDIRGSIWTTVSRTVLVGCRAMEGSFAWSRTIRIEAS